MEIWPPDVPYVVPARSNRLPPMPLLPLPTVIETIPARPDDAVPEPIEIEPLLPLLDVPVLNIKAPDTPLTPALAVCMTRTPELVAVP